MPKRARIKPSLSASSKAYKQKDYAAQAARAEARGLGRMDVEPYEPLISVRTSNTCGFAGRSPDPGTSLALTTLSHAESDVVRDILYRPGYVRAFTQVSLHRPTTQAIAEEFQLRHPTYPDKKTPLILSTDIVAMFEIDEVRSFMAVSVKSSRYLDKGDEIFAKIEKAYWERQKNATWQMRFRDQVNKNRIRNIRWIDKFHARCRLLPCPGRWKETEAALYPLLSQGRVLNQACHQVDAALGLMPGVCLTHVRFFLGASIWSTDLDQLINPFAPLTILARNLRTV